MAVNKKSSSASEALLTKEKTAVKTESNFIGTVAQEVEGMDQKKAFDLVPQLIEQGGENEFRLGGILSLIQTQDWKGDFQSFEELCESEFRIHSRKARYLIKIYNGLVEKQIPWVTVKNVGWSKLREMVDILTPKNAESWAKKAEKATVVQLIEAVRAHKAKQNGAADDDAEAKEKTVKTLTFKVHSDQAEVIREALDKAKAETNTNVDTVALANIATGYTGGSVNIVKIGAKKAKTLKGQAEYLSGLLTEYGLKVTLKAFDLAFPEVDIEVDMEKAPEGYGEPVSTDEAEAA